MLRVSQFSADCLALLESICERKRVILICQIFCDEIHQVKYLSTVVEKKMGI